MRRVMCTGVGRGTGSHEQGPCTSAEDLRCARIGSIDCTIRETTYEHVRKHVRVFLHFLILVFESGQAMLNRIPNAGAICRGIKRHVNHCLHTTFFPAHDKMPLELFLDFSYSHLLFNPTLALPVEGVGVPGVALDELSPNRLPLIGVPP